jgi:hypothetical protein
MLAGGVAIYIARWQNASTRSTSMIVSAVDAYASLLREKNIVLCLKISG